MSESSRLQAVPFWIVERSREIGKCDKTGANEHREGLGRVSSHLFVLAPVSLRCERIISNDQKGTACSLRIKRWRIEQIVESSLLSRKSCVRDKG